MMFKLKTYIEPATDENMRELFRKSRNYSGYYATASNFAYDVHTKIFYDAIMCAEYRCIRHELCLKYNGFDYKDTEPPNIIRLTFSSIGFYDGRGSFGGEYVHNDLGIEGLRLSGVYEETLGFERINQLKHYDFDLIESYIESIKQEQADIRASEPNLRENQRRFHKIQKPAN